MALVCTQVVALTSGVRPKIDVEKSIDDLKEEYLEIYCLLWKGKSFVDNLRKLSEVKTAIFEVCEG